MPILTSPTCTLRPLRAADQSVTLSWRQDLESVLDVMGYRLPVTEAGEAAWFRAVLDDQSRTRVSFGVTDPSDRLVGLAHLTGIDWIARQAELGIVIGDAGARGKGVGRSACSLLLRYGFGLIGLHRIWLRVAEGNAAAIAVYERLGFRTEGRLREAFWRDGGHVDVRVMGILAREWGGA